MPPEAPHTGLQVTVAIPTRDRPGMLQQALQSVLAQTWTAFEVVVIDDSADESSAAVVANLPDPRLRYERNPGPSGLSGAFNRCLAVARGDLVAILHDDDAWHPRFLATLVPLLEADPSIGFAFCDTELMDADGRIVERLAFLPTAHTFPAGALVPSLLPLNPIYASSVLARRSAYDLVGPFAHRLALDWDMWLRLAVRFPVAYVPEALARYRRGHGSLSDSLADRDGQLTLDRDAVLVLRDAIAADVRDPSPGARAPLRRALAERHSRLALAKAQSGHVRDGASEAMAGVRGGRLHGALAWAALALVAAHATGSLFGAPGRRATASLERRVKAWRRGRRA